MGDHYVPQYYLKGFSEQSGKRIWVYDKVQKRSFSTQVKSVFNETGFYSPTVEKYLANFVEGPANTVIEKIRARSHITDRDKEILSEYMAAFVMRVPAAKERVRKLAPSIAEKMSKEINQELTLLSSAQPEKTNLILKRKAEIEEILKRYSKEPPKKVWLDIIPPDRSPRVVAAIKTMVWRFLTFDIYPAFLSCDNPVSYFTGLGIGNPKSEISFPLSSNIVLWATWRMDLPNGYLPTSEKAVKEINRRTVRNATRFVVHCREESWILPFVLKGSWQIHRFQ